jgi:uncharacterized protein (TIGR03437 family)
MRSIGLPSLAFFLAGLAFSQTPQIDFWNWQLTRTPGFSPEGIIVDPTDSHSWYVSAPDGLYITRDNGLSWNRSLPGVVLKDAYAIDPVSPSRVYAVASKTLYVSNDKGLTWTTLNLFPDDISCLYVSRRDGTLYLAPRFSSTLSGIYKSTNRGQTWQQRPFGGTEQNLSCTAIGETQSGTLFIGIQRGASTTGHPFFRSTDGATTWTDVSRSSAPGETLDGYATNIEIGNGGVGVITSNGYRYVTFDSGNRWQFVGFGPPHTMVFVPDLGVVFAARSKGGGIYLSTPSDQVALSGVNIETLILAGSAPTLYATVPAGGIYTSPAFLPRLNVTTIRGERGRNLAIACPLCRYSTPTYQLLVGQQQIYGGFSYPNLTFGIPSSFPIGTHSAELVHPSTGTRMPFSLLIESSGAELTKITSVMFEEKVAYAPGEIVSLFGTRLTGSASAAPGPSNVTPRVPWGTRLNMTSIVLDDGAQQVPIQFAYTNSLTGGSQLNIQLPHSLTTGSHRIAVQQWRDVNTLEVLSNELTFEVNAESPTLLGNQLLPVYLQNVSQDPGGNVFVSGDRPARPGDVVTLYGTGFGITSPPVVAGALPAALSPLTARTEVQISAFRDGRTYTHPAQVLGAVHSPEFPGLYQLSFRFPADAAPDLNGLVTVDVRVGAGRRTFQTNLVVP